MPDTQRPYVRSGTRAARGGREPAGAERGSTPAVGGAPRGQLDLIAPGEHVCWSGPSASEARGPIGLRYRQQSEDTGALGAPPITRRGASCLESCDDTFPCGAVAEISTSERRGHAPARVCELIRRGGSCQASLLPVSAAILPPRLCVYFYSAARSLGPMTDRPLCWQKGPDP